MTEHNEELSPGERVAEGIWGRGYSELLRALLNSYDPGFPDHIVSFFEHTYGREALDVKTRQICTLCGLSALGLAPEMAIHFRGSLTLGWTQAELREAVLLTTFTAGIPKTINAFKVFQEVLTEMNLQPETDPDVPAEETALQKGLEKGAEFLGPVFDSLMEHVRTFDEGAARHLASDIFGGVMLRPRLTDRVRALIIIAACTVLGNEQMLRILMPGAVHAG
ncbi:MAG: carboxymuconolactone decarboxylase family protein, partial [Desulfomonilia bacterium]|nr:carboxymuconolactone decarboxylase family protein [Desulfomonilia bacterium]